jgi:hypothetical protein
MATSQVTSVVAGTTTSWHTVVLWFLGGVALLALADPAPKIATGLVLLLILGILLTNWPTYAAYLGLSKPGVSAGQAASAVALTNNVKL